MFGPGQWVILVHTSSRLRLLAELEAGLAQYPLELTGQIVLPKMSNRQRQLEKAPLEEPDLAMQVGMSKSLQQWVRQTTEWLVLAG